MIDEDACEAIYYNAYYITTKSDNAMYQSLPLETSHKSPVIIFLWAQKTDKITN